MLLIATDGSPIIGYEKVAEIRNIEPRTLLNQLYKKTCPIPMWKDGSDWFAHVSDVAAWIDQQREEARGAA